MAKRGPQATFANNKRVVLALRDIENGVSTISRYKIKQLVERGLVEEHRVHTGGRGRPAHAVHLTGRGRNLLRLSVNWRM